MTRSDQLEAMMAHIERRVVDVLAELPEWHTMPRRNIQRATYGSDTFGASHVASTLGRLKQRRLVVEPRRGVFRLTEAGRVALTLAAEIPGGAA